MREKQAEKDERPEQSVEVFLNCRPTGLPETPWSGRFLGKDHKYMEVKWPPRQGEILQLEGQCAKVVYSAGQGDRLIVYTVPYEENDIQPQGVGPAKL
ncbi:hypothetical protein FJZ40_03470 [Candidatus Shapirobacteria bacterium]|nr:hypothetical protein [Candidatus Shapirobacteria bacterium]